MIFWLPVSGLHWIICKNVSNYRHVHFPVIAARVRRNDEAIGQQRELHQLAVQRERLQIRALEEQTARQAEQNAAKSDREREVTEQEEFPSKFIQKNCLYAWISAARIADTPRTGITYAANAE